MAYGVFGNETKDNWEWFMKMLHKAIGSLPSLVISTDAGNGIDKAVTKVCGQGPSSAQQANVTMPPTT